MLNIKHGIAIFYKETNGFVCHVAQFCHYSVSSTMISETYHHESLIVTVFQENFIYKMKQWARFPLQAIVSWLWLFQICNSAFEEPVIILEMFAQS